MNNKTPREIWETIISAKNPILIIDSRFDYDAFGSALALREAINLLGKKLRLTYTDKVPAHAGSFINPEGVEFNTEPSSIDFSAHDLLIALDSANYNHMSKIGEFAPPENITKLKIDHHIAGAVEADINYVKEASSACRLLWEIFKENNVPITKNMGYHLVLGLLSDSGFLQYKSVDSNDFRMMAELMDVGVDVYEVFWKFSYNSTYDNYKFAEMVYRNLTPDYENRWVYSFYMLKDITGMKINMGKVYSKAADLIKRLENIDFAFVVKQNEDDHSIFDVSFRSRVNLVNVSVFAKALGGGGHFMAASGKVYGATDINDAIIKVIEMIKANKAEAYVSE